MAKLRMAHASTHGARKPPGPIPSSYAKILGEREKERLNDGNNNGQATHGACKHAWRTQAAWANCGRSEFFTLWPLVNTNTLDLGIRPSNHQAFYKSIQACYTWNYYLASSRQGHHLDSLHSHQHVHLPHKSTLERAGRPSTTSLMACPVPSLHPVKLVLQTCCNLLHMTYYIATHIPSHLRTDMRQAVYLQNVDYTKFALSVYNLQVNFQKNLHLQFLH